MNDAISTRKMPSENTRRSRVFSGIFPVEMASFIFLSEYRHTKAIFYLFYKITKVFPSFRDVSHVSTLRERVSSNQRLRRARVIL